MNFPLFCPKCKKEVIINVKDNHITTVREPDVDAEPISSMKMDLSALCFRCNKDFFSIPSRSKLVALMNECRNLLGNL